MNWKVKIGGAVLISTVIWGGLYYDAHSGGSPVSLASATDCQATVDYFQKSGTQFVPSQATPGLTYSANISIHGPGIISSNPVHFMCSQTGAVTIFGSNIKVDHGQAATALKTLAPVFLLGASTLHATEAQKAFFAEVGSKLQPDSEWKNKIENGYVLRVMTTQADENGNYFLTAHAGNAASYKE